MAEIRLIDANKIKPVHVEYHGAVVDWSTIEYAPTIDPETLPLVRQLREELARVTAERDAAVLDMEALMWHSGDGCEICEHKIVEQRHPYTKLGCKLEWGCRPKWRGPQKEAHP